MLMLPTGWPSLPDTGAPLEMGREGTPGQPVTFLVVEDDPSLRALLWELLWDEGYGVIVAPDGRDVLELVVQHRQGAILLDMGLPVTSGREVIRQLRAWERTGHIPVIALTGRSEPAPCADGQQPDVLIAKPFDLTVLLDHLARVVQPAGRDKVWATEDHDAG